MTDTHAHLDFLEPEELAEVKAHLPRLRAVLTLGVDPGRWEKTLSLAQGNVYAAVGLHPTSAHLLSPEVEEALRHYARNERVRAIGETGLDYHWTPETRPPSSRPWTSRRPWRRSSAYPWSSTCGAGTGRQKRTSRNGSWPTGHERPSFTPSPATPPWRRRD